MQNGFQSCIKSAHFDSWCHLWYFYSHEKNAGSLFNHFKLYQKSNNRNPLKVAFKPFTNSQTGVYSTEIRFCHIFWPLTQAQHAAL